MKPTLLTTHITTYQEKTWGRVFVTFEKEGKNYFAFKNFINFEELNYFGTEELQDEPAFSWFLEENRHEFTPKEVLEGKADHLFLTPEKHKHAFGTPSKLLKRLLIDIAANNLVPIEKRRGWYKNFYIPEIAESTIHITKGYNQIVLPEYEVELKFSPLHKLVYLMFLKHPEGLMRNEFVDKKEELMQIYQEISKSVDFTKNEKRVNSLIDLSKNYLHECISKIKKQLIDELGEKIALKYIIDGEKNERYKIGISPEKIKFL